MSEINILINIKSKFILKHIINNTQDYILLNIIRYNKKLQKQLNIDINDYKDCMKIELDVYPKENKYGMFINISEKNESCYKIYFDDNKEEVKRKYLTKKDNVKKIKIIINYKIKSLNKIFKQVI